MPSQETHLKVINGTKEDITATAVTIANPKDWEDKQGPAGNFQGVGIPAGQSVERREEVNYFASKCPFTMKLIFNDQTIDEYTINMKFAIGKAQPEFSHKGDRVVNYDQQDKYIIISVYDKAVEEK
ncbi:uncharacterized protein LOC123008904 [Tribolium madens]|uniref:uncharacterized protein LOC123008904 n=1 Tax=Tribolium madens TaxID=41895 RepID=UPI001CF74D5A|nr:uncharacterized protein LOC123008904 [Tribolium madens]